MSKRSTLGNAPSLVVGVGASAGGLQAYKALLRALSASTGSAYVLVQHLDPTHESLLSELLVPCTEMQVLDARHGMTLDADTVYVIAPGCALAVSDGRIKLSEPTLHRGVRLPVNHLFRSLAREYGSRSVAIILSGAGSDGSEAIRDIKAAGGLVIAQETESSGHTGMPQSAIDTGLADLVLAIEDMPEALRRFDELPESARLDPSRESMELAASGDDDDVDALNGEGRSAKDWKDHDDSESGVPKPDAGGTLPCTAATDAASVLRAAEPSEKQLKQLNSLVESQSDFNLGTYKSSTIKRRLLRRLLLSGIDDIDDYLDHLRRDPKELHLFLRDLLISVTSFFRDASAYKTLRESVIEPMIASLAPNGEVRVWVAGCATGEEAYSIGMTILDAAEERDKSIALQIFATDVDQSALAVAREGLYAASAVEQVSSRRLNRYFDAQDGRGYRVRSFLRDRISFAMHDLTRDPPFSRMHLVSCRNVMIYLTPEAQEHCLGIIHFALRAEGCLFLSTSEVTGARRDLFTTLSKSAHIFRKVGNSRASLTPFSTKRRHAGANSGKGKIVAGGQQAEPEGDVVTDPARRLVLEALAPPTVVVSGDGDVIFLHGELGAYLRFPQGEQPRLQLDSMLRDAYATRTLGAVYRCRRQNEPVVVTAGLEQRSDCRVQISARPASALSSGAVMLTFEEVATGAGADAAGSDSEADAIIRDSEEVRRLEEDLRATREDLRSTVEELETSNEELRSANEESMSMNEELQASNEELESTTEELRSLNEELSTVNVQLRDKIEQQEQTNDDLSNFFASADVPIVFLDEQLRIKRFTPSASLLLGIDQSDVGRYATDIARELLQADLEAEARWVLEHLTSRSTELKLRDGRWFIRKVLPYRTESRQIEGVVVNLSDVTELKVASEQLAARERQQRVIARLGLAALGEGDLQGFMDQAVREIKVTLDLDHCKVLELQPGARRLLLRSGVGWDEGLVGSGWVDTGSDSQAGFTLSVDEPVIVEDLATESRFSGPALLTDHSVTSGVSCIIRAGDRVYGVIGGHTRSRHLFSREDGDFLQAAAHVIGSMVNRQEDQTRQALDAAVSRLLYEYTDRDDTLAAVQSTLVTELGCDVSELWWANEQGDLECRLLHTLPHERRQHVRDCLSERDIDAAEDPVFQVRNDLNAIWATDLGHPGLFAEDSSARQLGFTSAFAFPIRQGQTLLGVMTLYARRRLVARRAILLSLDAIGSDIGVAIARLSRA